MIDLPPPPKRIARLPKDNRGYPVPWFLAWMSQGEECPPAMPGAEPDFRLIKHGAREKAWRQGLCWICGEPMGVHKVYVIGPMCVVNRTTLEPANHRECAEYAAKACPFLVRPRMKRIPRDDLGSDFHVDGEMLERNPGAVCLYETALARPFDAGNGWLIRLDAPTRVDWWARGRQATRAEIFESIMSGLPLLRADEEGPEAVAELARRTAEAMMLLPA